MAAAVAIATVVLLSLAGSPPSMIHSKNEGTAVPARISTSSMAASMPALTISTDTPQSPATQSLAPRSAAVASHSRVRENCAVSPHMCGYPDLTNSGVPASARLRSVPRQVSSGPGWTYDPRGWVEVYGNGAVLSNLYIPYTLDISASNVTINDVEVVETGPSMGIGLRHTQNVVIENSDIYSPYGNGPNRLQVGIKDVYGDSVNTTVKYDNIWNASTGIQLSQGMIEDNYIHDLAYKTGNHVNGIVSDAGESTGLSILHNTVFNPVGQTDAIALFESFGQQMNATVSNNLLAGGGYTVYGGANPGREIPFKIVITNNRFSTLYYPQSGYYGPDAGVDPGVNGNVWTSNVWDKTGRPIKP